MFKSVMLTIVFILMMSALFMAGRYIESLTFLCLLAVVCSAIFALGLEWWGQKAEPNPVRCRTHEHDE